MSGRRVGYADVVVIIGLSLLIILGAFFAEYFRMGTVFTLKNTVHITNRLDSRGTGIVSLLGSGPDGNKFIQQLAMEDEIPDDMNNVLTNMYGVYYNITVSQGSVIKKAGRNAPDKADEIVMEIPLPGVLDNSIKGKVRLKEW
ncbi:MAG: hypothetical protein KKC05_02070 [Nanoarchaeota archaeon]|nr:hypothetical protein [Nanoarchaeota archaeon]